MSVRGDCERLPSGFLIAERAIASFCVGQDILPWCTDDPTIDLVRVQTRSGKIFIGSCVVGDLEDYAEAAQNFSSATDKNFYSLAHKIIQNQFTSLPRIQSTSAPYPIYYSKTNNFRVYVMHVPSNRLGFLGRDSAGLLLRVAVCLKSNEEKVLKIISDSKNTKY